jgi:hypothetical protein
VKEKTEPSVPTPASMVDPEVGRPPGGFEAPAKPIIPSDYHLKQEVLSKSGPIRSSSGKIIKQKAFAEAYMEQLGIKGKLVKDGEGWRIRKSKAEKERFEKELREDYERQLREEGLGEIEPETGLIEDLTTLFGDESGQVKVDFAEVRDALDRLKLRFGKAPKTGTLLNRLQKEIKKDDLDQLGVSGYLISKPAQTRLDWGDLLDTVRDKGIIRSETLRSYEANYGPDSHPNLTLPKSPPEAGTVTMPSNRIKSYQERLYKYDPREGAPFQESHWGRHGKNVWAHRRAHERQMADGKEVFYVDELQSVWIERGKQEGFKGAEEKSTQRPAYTAEDWHRLYEEFHTTYRDQGLRQEVFKNFLSQDHIRNMSPDDVYNLELSVRSTNYLIRGLRGENVTPGKKSLMEYIEVMEPDALRPGAFKKFAEDYLDLVEIEMDVHAGANSQKKPYLKLPLKRTGIRL